jgi:hypothetical protein
MNKAKVRGIIETTLSSGNKTPGLFDLPKMLGVKSRLESSSSIAEVVEILEANRKLISKSFGLNDAVVDDSLLKLKSIETLV